MCSCGAHQDYDSTMKLNAWLRANNACESALRDFCLCQTDGQRLALFFANDKYRFWLWDRAYDAYVGDHAWCSACRRGRAKDCPARQRAIELDRLTIEERVLFCLFYLDWCGVDND